MLLVEIEARENIKSIGKRKTPVSLHRTRADLKCVFLF